MAGVDGQPGTAGDKVEQGKNGQPGLKGKTERKIQNNYFIAFINSFINLYLMRKLKKPVIKCAYIYDNIDSEVNILLLHTR